MPSREVSACQPAPPRRTGGRPSPTAPPSVPRPPAPRPWPGSGPSAAGKCRTAGAVPRQPPHPRTRHGSPSAPHERDRRVPATPARWASVSPLHAAASDATPSSAAGRGTAGPASATSLLSFTETNPAVLSLRTTTLGPVELDHLDQITVVDQPRPRGTASRPGRSSGHRFRKPHRRVRRQRACQVRLQLAGPQQVQHDRPDQHRRMLSRQLRARSPRPTAAPMRYRAPPESGPRR